MKKAGQLEAEYCPKEKVIVGGARDDPQMQNVMKTLREIKYQIQQAEKPVSNP